MQITN